MKTALTLFLVAPNLTNCVTQHNEKHWFLLSTDRVLGSRAIKTPSATNSPRSRECRLNVNIL